MKTITKFLIIAFIFSLPTLIQARHIIGGTFAYNVKSVSNGMANVEITLYVYRDVNGGGANFDNNLSLGIHKFFGSDYQFVSIYYLNPSSVETIELQDLGGCTTDMIEYELGTYVEEISLPLNDYDYFTISYQRCCRGTSISNIMNPEETGIAISMDLYPKAFEILNQSMEMQTSFPVIAEANSNATFDFSVDDNFSKKYYLSDPKAAGGTQGVNFGDPMGCDGITPDPVVCTPDFDVVTWVNNNNPYGSGTDLELDEENGEMTFNIPGVSSILVGYTLERFEDDVLFSRIRNQFLINTLDCVSTNTSESEVNEFRIAPNPTNGHLSLSTSLTEVSILDITGKRQSLNSSYKTYNKLDVSHLENGVYYLRGKTSAGQWIFEKVLIAK